MADLKIKYCNKLFNNPFIVPSGILPDHKAAISAGVGGITLKTLTADKRMGNPFPRVCVYDCGMLNSVGIANPGIEKGAIEAAKIIRDNPKTPVIVSVFSTKVKEFTYLVEQIVPIKPAFIELNLSCPNVEQDFGQPLGMEKGAAGMIIKEVKKISGKIPVLAKLSPNVSNIAEIAKSCEAEGADGIVAINTVGPGMIIDINKKRPVLGAIKGGLSGPGILPITIRCVYEIFEAVKIPIIGMGGISKWQDVVQVLMAGATLIGVGTATYSKGVNLYGELGKGLSEFMDKNNYTELKKLVGLAHEK